MRLMLLGAAAMACFAAALFFLRFWRDTRDRLFLFFATAFSLAGIERVALGLLPPADEHEPYVYLLRLVAFSLILLAIVDKNRQRPRRPGA